jgi:hypothetical protein
MELARELLHSDGSQAVSISKEILHMHRPSYHFLPQPQGLSKVYAQPHMIFFHLVLPLRSWYGPLVQDTNSFF